MTNQMMISKDNAESLAISYSAYNEARALPNDDPKRISKVALWASMLLDDQNTTGVEMVPEWLLKSCMKDGRQ